MIPSHCKRLFEDVRREREKKQLVNWFRLLFKMAFYNVGKLSMVELDGIKLERKRRRSSRREEKKNLERKQ